VRSRHYSASARVDWMMRTLPPHRKQIRPASTLRFDPPCATLGTPVFTPPADYRAGLPGRSFKSRVSPPIDTAHLNRPLKKDGLMGNGKWKMAKTYGGFAISHLPFAIQDAFSASCESLPYDYPRSIRTTTNANSVGSPIPGRIRLRDDAGAERSPVAGSGDRKVRFDSSDGRVGSGPRFPVPGSGQRSDTPYDSSGD
jgi:hypothetical protein